MFIAGLSKFWSLFLSTPSARRATPPQFLLLLLFSDFYPRPPRGGRPMLDKIYHAIDGFLSTPSARRATSAEAAANRAWQISIHALREEGDHCEAHDKTMFGISIHALREEGDGSKARQSLCHRYFYPRPPRGGRPASISRNEKARVFLSTPSARRATAKLYFTGLCRKFLSTPSARRATKGKEIHFKDVPISIHALREEGDVISWLYQQEKDYFYPRPPRGGRPTHCLL